MSEEEFGVTSGGFIPDSEQPESEEWTILVVPRQGPGYKLDEDGDLTWFASAAQCDTRAREGLVPEP
jgi:hypothetical protein